MTGALMVLLLCWNLFVSWGNAKFVGMNWKEGRKNGFVWWINICAAIMSACGFTWCYALIISTVGGAFGWIPPEAVKAIQELTYVFVIMPILGSGLGITVYTLRRAWESGDSREIGNAAYNVFAQASNTYDAIVHMPSIFADLGSFFGGSSSSKSSSSSSSKDDDNGGGAIAMVVVGLVIFAIIGGIWTTVQIIVDTANER